MDLGLNIDHIATLREARQIAKPDPLEAVFIATNAGANQITIHLREDRRHINEFDVKRIIENSPLPVNVECACNEEVIEILCKLKPFKITLVPEKREEITTEGGLEITKRVGEVIKEFKKHKIKVATFIDSNEKSISLSKDFNADGVELHTGEFANLYDYLYSNFRFYKAPNEFKKLDSSALESRLESSLDSLKYGAKLAKNLNLGVYAGHGLNYQNVKKIIEIKEFSELNIGHSIIARAVIVGLNSAIKEMKQMLKG